jgi:carbonic anhydrase
MGEKQQWVIYQKDGEQKNGKSSNNKTQMTIWISCMDEKNRTGTIRI